MNILAFEVSAKNHINFDSDAIKIDMASDTIFLY